jgi:Glutamate mutase epsilon subunit
VLLKPGLLTFPLRPANTTWAKRFPREMTMEPCASWIADISLSDEIKNFHLGKMEERGKKEKRAVSFQMVIDDIYAIGKGYLVGRPK